MIAMRALGPCWAVSDLSGGGVIDGEGSNAEAERSRTGAARLLSGPETDDYEAT